jgi:hypothetical protein
MNETRARPIPVLLFFGILIAGLGGCAQSHWVKPGGSAPDLNYDQTTCDQLARQRNRYYEAAPGGINVREFTDECMVHFGWTLERPN